MSASEGRLSTARRVSLAGVLLIGVAGALLADDLVAWLRSDDRDTRRQAQVAARGAEVMPFDLDRTTHMFDPAADGGIETVVADDPQDAEQIELIRAHLEHEARRFSEGDFRDPMRIHGRDMPGLRALQRGADRIRFVYQTVPAGAQIRYVTTDPALVDALHMWFRAQTMDHGEHAEQHP